MRYVALSVALGSFLIIVPAHACELGDKVCADEKFLALGGDPRELAEMDLAAQRFKQVIHCPPLDIGHPGRCDRPDENPAGYTYAEKRMHNENRAAHMHACQLGYALRGTCN
jgi:hypothetical protein